MKQSHVLRVATSYTMAMSHNETNRPLAAIQKLFKW